MHNSVTIVTFVGLSLLSGCGVFEFATVDGIKQYSGFCQKEINNSRQVVLACWDGLSYAFPSCSEVLGYMSKGWEISAVNANSLQYRGRERNAGCGLANSKMGFVYPRQVEIVIEQSRDVSTGVGGVFSLALLNEQSAPGRTTSLWMDSTSLENIRIADTIPAGYPIGIALMANAKLDDGRPMQWNIHGVAIVEHIASEL